VRTASFSTCHPTPPTSTRRRKLSKIKVILRKSEARTREVLIEAIGTAASVVSARDAQGFSGHCGYHSQVQLL
jgi:hypothetical protein